MAIEIGSLLINMQADVARLVQDMAKATQTVDGAMGKIQRAAGAATTALGLIGAGVSIAGMVNVVKGAIDVIAALDDMAEKTGASVENLSALADVAAIGGHQIGTVEMALIRLNKALAGGDDEAKSAGNALAALGLKAEELRQMDPAEAMLKVAQALDEYADGGGKAALMMDLLGKSGAQLLPYLKDLAETGRLQGSVTAEQAAQAEKLQKDLNAVALEGDKLKRAMIAGWLPAMTDISKAMRLAAEEGGTLKAMLVGFGGVATEVFNPLVALFKQLGASMHETAADFNEWMAKFASGDVKHNLLKTAIQERAAAQRIYAEMAALGRSQSGMQPADDKPKLNYTPAVKGGGGSDRDTALDRMLKRGHENLAATIDSEEEMAKIAQKREADDAKRHADRLRHFEELAQARELDAYYATAGEETIREEMEKTNRKLTDQNGLARDLGMTFSSAFEDAIVSGKEFSDVLRGLAQDVARLFLRKQVTEPMAGALGGLFGKLDLGGLFGGGSSPGGGGSDSLWMPSPEAPSWDGGGYTGNAPRIGGLDGKGGFWAIMHPQETVTDHARGGSGGGGAAPITVQLNFAVGIAQTVRAEVLSMMPQIQAATTAGIVDARRRGGAVRAAFAR